ncbi:MAG: hypothetical protein GWO86_02845 [Planctomycetes bacterium]|nr:hypothetical protein [Planctomycetota bacterium]
MVISIIALLLAILMPSLGKARDQAKNIICQNNLHQQSITLGSYAASNNGLFPEHNNIVPGYVSDTGTTNGMPNTDMTILLKSYVPDPWIWYCPVYARRSRLFNSPDYVDPGWPNYCGWNKKSLEDPWNYSESQLNVAITYQLMTNWQLGKYEGYVKYVESYEDTGVIKYYPRGKKTRIRRMSDIKPDRCLSSDQVNMLYNPVDFSTLSKDAFGGTNIAHPYELGGVNVLFGTFSVQKRTWRDIKLRIEFQNLWPNPQYIYW